MIRYVPIFDQECECCDVQICVGVRDPETGYIRSSGMCGPHFFRDGAMVYWESWNDVQEATE